MQRCVPCNKENTEVNKDCATFPIFTESNSFSYSYVTRCQQESKFRIALQWIETDLVYPSQRYHASWLKSLASCCCLEIYTCESGISRLPLAPSSSSAFEISHALQRQARWTQVAALYTATGSTCDIRAHHRPAVILT